MAFQVRHFQSGPLQTASFHVSHFHAGPFQTNSYLIHSGDKAVVVDPAPDSFNEIVRQVQDDHLELQALWVTHSHWDHMADSCKFLENYGVAVCVHQLDAENVEFPGKDGVPTWQVIQGVKPSSLLQDQDLLYVGESVWQVIHTPGHSPGSACFYQKEQKVLFSGDVLFRGTCGNVSFPTSSPALMADSLEKLLLLPEETRVFPGHGPETILRNEVSWMRELKEVLRSDESNG